MSINIKSKITIKSKEHKFATRHWAFGHVATLLAFALAACAQAHAANAGLLATFTSTSTGARDVTIASNVCLFVREGKASTPFLPPGKFTATWQGNIGAELRSDFAFQAELNGDLKLEINGKEFYAASSADAPLSKPVQLNKGPNAFRATYTSPNKGDAFLRLWWTEKGTNTIPIPSAALTHSATPELKQGFQLRLGRELFLEYRCFNCHKNRYEESVPELTMDAPSFEGIGARRNYEWMSRWILDPQATRASVHMPKTLRGPTANEDAAAIAACLSSLKTGGEGSVPEPKIQPKPNSVAADDAAPSGDQRSLFEKLHCSSCHNAPDENHPDPKKISLKHVAQKFAPGKLAEFLRAPEAHFTWIRMPNFHLTNKEANELADFLLTKADKGGNKAAPSEKAVLDRGLKLVQESGCLNCHAAKLENKFSAPALPDLTPAKWNRGCLATEARSDSKAPDFGFSAEERAALQEFGKTDRQSLTRHVPSEFAERETRLLNCAGCHGQVEGFPPLELLGGKLKPEWAAKFIGGEMAYKPRAEKHPRGEPWLEARMPAFKSRAHLLADGLAAQHGFPPQTPAEPPVDAELAKIGQKMVGKDGGFSCVSCHGVGSQEALEVVDAEGINFAYSADRLLSQYYRRWMRNPLAIDPQTKMPAYFEEGRSPLTDVLDGDAEKQISAIWQYLRLGSKIAPPSTGAQ